MNIEKLAEEKYPTTGFFARSEIRKGEQKAFIAGYQSCETRSKKIVDLLKEELVIYEEAVKVAAKEKDTETIVKTFLPRITKIKQSITDYEGEEGIK